MPVLEAISFDIQETSFVIQEPHPLISKLLDAATPDYRYSLINQTVADRITTFCINIFIRISKSPG